MKIIITAGGTTEKIDPVRKITNTATGKLGSLIANAFVKQGGNRIEKIYYLCEKEAFVPSLACMEIVPVEGVNQVKEALTRLLTTQEIDAVIHSMAVSDYTVESATTAENLADFLADKLFPLDPTQFQSKDSLACFIAASMKENDRLLDNSSKIGSDVKNLILSMRQTPKLIGLIKSLQPSTILVGFKLLNGVNQQQLFDAGYGVLTKNACDMVLANDLIGIGNGRHAGMLIAPDKSYTAFQTKDEIANGIVRQVLNRMDKRVS